MTNIVSQPSSVVWQGFWQNAWWISTVKEVEDDGTVVCMSDHTPVYPEGEEWEVEAENLRAGHPQEALGFGMLNSQLAPPAVPKSIWRCASLDTFSNQDIPFSSLKRLIIFHMQFCHLQQRLPSLALAHLHGTLNSSEQHPPDAISVACHRNKGGCTS